MLRVSSEIPFSVQPLSDRPVAELEERYGVRFVAPEQDQLDGFADTCETLAGALESVGGVALRSKPVVVYEPQVFLAEPLSTAQTAAINEAETPRIAAYCVGVQDRLAAVPISETGDPMVHLPTAFSAGGIEAGFSDTTFHAACGEWAGKPREFWSRSGLAQRLLVLGSLASIAGSSPHFEDAFRPVGVQEGLFQRRVAWTVRDHPEWDDEHVVAEARSKTAVTPRLASHKGGAAVDLRLRDRSTGEILDFGHNYPDGGALVFPRSPFLTAEQWRNRQLLQVVAGLSGLTLYVGEDWHVSYGDNLASLDERARVQPGYVASYGPVKDFDRATGAITEVYAENELDTVFPRA